MNAGQLAISAAIILAFAAVLIVSWQIVRPQTLPGSTKIVVIFKSTDPAIFFWQIVKAGVEAAAKEYGVDCSVIGPKEEKDIPGQIAMVNAAVREHPQAIVLAADDYHALVPAAREIRAAGIRLVTIDSGLAGNLSSSFIATNNDAAGEQAGREFARLLGGGGKVAIVSYVKGTTTAIERERGVRAVLARDPGVSILGTYYSDDLESRAYAITAGLLEDTPKLRGIIALNEVATVGAAKALAHLRLENRVVLVGFDNSPVEIRYLESGVIKGIMLQKPFNIGYLGVVTAIKLLKGERVSRRIDTGSLFVTKSNMYERESEKLLFPLISAVYK